MLKTYLRVVRNVIYMLDVAKRDHTIEVLSTIEKVKVKRLELKLQNLSEFLTEILH